MAAVPPHPERRRARPGSVARPVNGRLYRGTWLLVGLPLLVLAFSVARPPALGSPNPVDETRWLQEAYERTGIPNGIVAECHLAEANAAGVPSGGLAGCQARSGTPPRAVTGLMPAATTG